MLIEIWKAINHHFTGLKPPFSQATSPKKNTDVPGKIHHFSGFFPFFPRNIPDFSREATIFPRKIPRFSGRVFEVVTDQRFAFVAMDLSMAPTRGLQLGFGALWWVQAMDV